MGIVYIPGIHNENTLSDGWERDLINNFPEEDVHIIKSDYHAKCKEIKEITERVRHKIETLDSPVMIIGHSLGGLIAKKMAKEFKDKVGTVVTLATPHRRPRKSEKILISDDENYKELRFLPIANKIFGFPKDVEEAMLISVGGIYDDWVPDSIAHTENSERHTIDCRHNDFYEKQEVRDEVIEIIKTRREV